MGAEALSPRPSPARPLPPHNVGNVPRLVDGNIRRLKEQCIGALAVCISTPERASQRCH